MEKKLFLYVATCWKLSTFLILSRIYSTASIGHPECIKHDLELVHGKCLFLHFNVTTCWKLCTMLISSQIDSKAKIGHPECIKHDLKLVYGKVLISVCCNLLKIVHLVHFVSNKQHSNNWTSRVHQIWFRACLWKRAYFCISMLQLAENCPPF
jgi:hypothetical protein